MNKKLSFAIVLILLAASLLVFTNRTTANQESSLKCTEYVTIRWDGLGNTHIIRPGGEVEHLGPQLKSFKKPSATDDRSFYMNIVMNSLAKEEKWPPLFGPKNAFIKLVFQALKGLSIICVFIYMIICLFSVYTDTLPHHGFGVQPEVSSLAR